MWPFSNVTTSLIQAGETHQQHHRACPPPFIPGDDDLNNFLAHIGNCIVGLIFSALAGF
jgi:hypothetical protein